MASLDEILATASETVDNLWSFEASWGVKITKKDLEEVYAIATRNSDSLDPSKAKPTKLSEFEDPFRSLISSAVYLRVFGREEFERHYPSLFEVVYGDMSLSILSEFPGARASSKVFDELSRYISDIPMQMSTRRSIRLFSNEELDLLVRNKLANGILAGTIQQIQNHFPTEYSESGCDVVMAAMIYLFREDKGAERNFFLTAEKRGSLDVYERTLQMDSILLGGWKKYLHSIRADKAKEQHLKRRIYLNDRETMQAAKELGVKFEPFINLTDPEVVYRAVEELRTSKKLFGGQIYQSVLTGLRKNYGLELSAITREDVNIYSDEISVQFEQALSKIRNENIFPELRKHMLQARHSGNVSFGFASRDDDDRTLGDRCGDCTAEDGINHKYVEGWVSDINTQFLKLYYNGGFIGRLNVVLCRNGNEPLILIDAIEFIPQAGEHGKYEQRATEAFKAGIEKVIEISNRMNVPHIAANIESNSTEVGDILNELGYRDSSYYNIALIRKKPLHKVVGKPYQISYFLQTTPAEGEGLTRTQIRCFEHFMNTKYLTDAARRQELKELLDHSTEENIGAAREKIVRFDEEKHLHPHLKRLRLRACDVEACLRILYAHSLETPERPGEYMLLKIK